MTASTKLTNGKVGISRKHAASMRYCNPASNLKVVVVSKSTMTDRLTSVHVRREWREKCGSGGRAVEPGGQAPPSMADSTEVEGNAAHNNSEPPASQSKPKSMAKTRADGGSERCSDSCKWK